MLSSEVLVVWGPRAKDCDDLKEVVYVLLLCCRREGQLREREEAWEKIEKMARSNPQVRH